MAVSACVSVFVALCGLDCVDLVSVVAFNIVFHVAGVKEISKEEDDGVKPVTSSSASLAGRLEQLYLNTQAQSVCVRDEVDSRYSVHHQDVSG